MVVFLPAVSFVVAALDIYKREMFDYAYSNQTVAQVTVNSSSFAVRFYESLGFRKTAEEQVTNGLRYTPMFKLA